MVIQLYQEIFGLQIPKLVGEKMFLYVLILKMHLRLEMRIKLVAKQIKNLAKQR